MPDLVSPPTSTPSQVHGQAISLQGQAYEAIGNLTGSEAWKTSGQSLVHAGEEELDEARRIAKAEASQDKVVGKVESAWGMVTGDTETQKEGNLKTEGANWKKSLADGELPLMDKKTVGGKVQSAVGMLIGDQSKQNEGNLKVEKAEWGL